MPGISLFCNMSIDPVAQERSIGMDTIPKVIQTVAGPDYTVYAYFHDGPRNPETCVDLDPCEMYETCLIVDDPLREMSRPHEKPLDISTLSRKQLHAEMEKGYTDIAEGRTKSAEQVFASIW